MLYFIMIKSASLLVSGCCAYNGEEDELVSAYDSHLNIGSPGILTTADGQDYTLAVDNFATDKLHFNLVPSNPTHKCTFKNSFGSLLDSLRVGLDVRTKCVVREVDYTRGWVDEYVAGRPRKPVLVVLDSHYNNTNFNASQTQPTKYKARCVVVSCSPTMFAEGENSKITVVPDFAPVRKHEYQKLLESASMSKRRVVVNLSFAHRPWPATMRSVRLTNIALPATGTKKKSQDTLLASEIYFSVADTRNGEGKNIGNTAFIATFIFTGAQHAEKCVKLGLEAVSQLLLDQLGQIIVAVLGQQQQQPEQRPSEALPPVKDVYLSSVMHDWSNVTHPYIFTSTESTSNQTSNSPKTIDNSGMNFELLSKQVGSGNSGIVLFCGDYLLDPQMPAKEAALGLSPVSATPSDAASEDYKPRMYSLETALRSGVRAAGEVAQFLNLKSNLKL
jgi:hypothetical protein